MKTAAPSLSSMNIAVVGAGAIGTAFAFQLAQAGHAVTVVARGARLAKLREDGGIVTHDGRRADVAVVDAFDVEAACDLVLCTVLAPQVAAVLPALSRSRAKRVMFMFNTFEPIEPLRAAVGDDRFAFGFPGGVFSLLKEGRIDHTVRAGTTVDDDAHARLFSAAGIPTVTTPDMQAWLRTHAALVVGLMAVGVQTVARGAGVTWSQAWAAAKAEKAAFRLVRAMGHPLLPSGIGSMGALPTTLWALTLWLGSRAAVLRDLGQLGPHEPRMLIDQMTALPTTPATTKAALLAIRP